MTTRELPPSEWPMLMVAGFELGTIAPSLNPACARIIVEEDETGRIVACACFWTQVYLDGFEVAKDRRGTDVGKRLLEALAVESHAISGGVMLSTPKNRQWAKMLKRLGASVETVYRWSVPQTYQRMFRRHEHGV